MTEREREREREQGNDREREREQGNDRERERERVDEGGGGWSHNLTARLTIQTGQQLKLVTTFNTIVRRE